MKKWIIVVIVLVVAILVVPMPSSPAKDGGTRQYTALTYKIVDWNALTPDAERYDVTKIYFFPNNFKTLKELWLLEEPNVKHVVRVKVLQYLKDTVVVEPLEGEPERRSYDQMTFSYVAPDVGISVGDMAEIVYVGDVMETYPAQINVVSWKLWGDMQDVEYKEQWLDSAKAESYGSRSGDYIISAVYANCFFVKPATLGYSNLKINAKLPEGWCVGDVAHISIKNWIYDASTNHGEADLVSIDRSISYDSMLEAAKPVIYLYPQETMEVSVKLKLEGEITCAYPQYGQGWNVIAELDGTLTDSQGKKYNYLYWEGITEAQWDMSSGFCIKGEKTAEFLEETLEHLGLNRREANEFIVYWLPLMEQNPYNVITFKTDVYNKVAELDINPVPDTLIRVFMVWKGVDGPVDLIPEQLSAPERQGFTVVEWGGAEIK